VETLKLPDVIMAILDCRSRFPRATSAALIREHEDDDVFVYIVLLDDKRQPISVEPGTITAATYVARHLGEDLVAAFGGKKAIVLKLGPAEWGGRPGQTPAGQRRAGVPAAARLVATDVASVFGGASEARNEEVGSGFPHHPAANSTRLAGAQPATSAPSWPPAQCLSH
jgi:hypothetical protein